MQSELGPSCFNNVLGILINKRISNTKQYQGAAKTDTDTVTAPLHLRHGSYQHVDPF